MTTPLSATLTALFVHLLVTSPEPDAGEVEPAPTRLTADMPDPHANEWAPPPGPTPPPPPPPPTTSSVDARDLPPPGLAPEAPKHGHRLKVSGLVFGGLGISGLAIGGYMFDEARKTEVMLNTEKLAHTAGASTPSELASLEAKLARQQTVMVAGLAAGGSALGLGTILFITGAALERGAATPTVSIIGGARFVGAQLSGRF